MQDASSPIPIPGSPDGEGLRVVIYSHDTYGLGHLTRTHRIATGIVEALPAACVLIISGSPIAHRFDFPDRVDYLKLPSVVKLGPSQYGSRQLAITPRRIRRLRSRLILNAVDLFRPGLLMVDNVPLGMKGELRPALRHLRRKHPGSRIHLNLRDILDDADAIRATWEQAGMHEILDEFYDAIHVFGSRDVYDAQAAYGLPADRTEFLGYIGPAPSRPAPGQQQPAPDGPSQVLVTVGGGGDGEEILRAVADLQERFGAASPYRFIVATGPLMDTVRRKEIADRLASLPGIDAHEFLDDLPGLMRGSELVLSMGGYNTLCEVMSHARRSLVVPRQYPRREQSLRAELLAGRDLLRVLPMDRLDADSLGAAIESSLAEGPEVRKGNLPPLDGIAALQERLRLPKQGGTEALTRRRLARDAVKGLLLAVCLIPAAAGFARADLRPDQVELGFRVGYDGNLLNASDAELAAFETDSPEALFAVDAMEDRFLQSGAEARWTLGRPLGVKTQLGASYERLQYLGNGICSGDRFGAELLARLDDRTRARLELAHRPQVYGRHRRDKDAGPGEPMFRAEVHRRWDASFELRRTLAEDWRVEAEVGGSWRDYVESFAERDRRRLELDCGLGWRAASELDLALNGSYRRSHSRNEPDLGKDLSYGEWRLEPTLELALERAELELELGLLLRWREYLSERAEDWNHYGRHDRFGRVAIELRHALSPELTLVGGFAHAWRRAELDSGVTIDYDEEGSFSESVFGAGVDWRWRP